MPQLDTVTFFNQALSLFAFFFVSLPLFVYSMSKFTSLVSAFRAQTYAGLGRLSDHPFPGTLSRPLSLTQPDTVSPVDSTKLEGLKRSLLRSSL
uniref:Uncharacterized protein n=1 Tax=Lotharella oceanica TaxID=641309 RepID=A0A140GYR0_9EUKA|nr:hypothetical protein AN617_33 [Lotharella oceanica]AMN87082.1 hypothetical protein AN617_33 [Lotharella oceanica]